MDVDSAPGPQRPGWFPWLLAGGGLAAGSAVVAAGVVGPPGYARPFTDWGGLLHVEGVWPDHERWPGLLLAVALCSLVLLWLVAVRSASRSGGWSTRDVWVLGTAWLTPLVVGPPILSNDVFSYVAQGAVAASGEDPTAVSSYALGWTSPLLQAVDPMWRGTPSPYGPGATLLQKLLVDAAGGHPVLAVLALRLIAAASVAGIAALALGIHRATTAGTDRRREVLILALVWANPLLSLHVVAAVHLEGVLVLCVLLAVRLVVVRSPAADLGALVCAAAAAAVKLPVGGVAAAAVLAVLVGRVATPTARLRQAATGLVAVVGTYAVLCVAAGSGWNVLAVVRAPAAGRTPAAPATLVADALTPLRWFGTTDGATLDTVGRLLCALAAVAAVVFLVVTAARRCAPATVGLALLALAAGSPVLYPWYLVWSVPLLAVVATGAWRRRLVFGSALGAVMTVQGLTHWETWGLVGSIVVTALVVVWRTEAAARRDLVDAVRRRAAALRTAVSAPGR